MSEWEGRERAAGAGEQNVKRGLRAARTASPGGKNGDGQGDKEGRTLRNGLSVGFVSWNAMQACGHTLAVPRPGTGANSKSPQGMAARQASVKASNGGVDGVDVVNSQQPLQQRLIALKLIVIHLLRAQQVQQSGSGNLSARSRERGRQRQAELLA